ncbi:MAG: putative pyridoxal-dependent aspartate 1-decarboxylase, partial [Motiliproteus sp.]|nr:putative pyridoxal-dependent aspartate 1-decarboxylase [Motiliproteus sp.]
MTDSNKHACASLENLYRIFTVPEAPDSTLMQLDDAISDNMIGFLQQHIVAEETDLLEIEKDFTNTDIPEEPVFVSEQTE